MRDEQRLSRVERKKREYENNELDSKRAEVNEHTNEMDPVEPTNSNHGQEESPFLHERSEAMSNTSEKSVSKKVARKRHSLPRFTSKKRKGERPRQTAKDTNSPRSDSVNRSPESVPPKQKRQRKRKGKIALLLLVMLMVLGYVATAPFTFLVMGSDARVGESLSGSRTDSLQLMEFVPRSRTVQNVSIPRDTYTTIPCEPEQEGDKITHAFAYGGADCTVGAVEEFADTSVDGQVVITFESFMELIDLIGGVNLTATHSFSEKGFKQTYEYTEGVSYAMDGDMALAYARHRKSDTDGARSNRQTEVMTAVAEKLASPSGWTKIPATYRFMKEEMGLEMNVFQMASVGLTIISRPEVNKMQVEGQDAYINNIYYYEPLEESVQAIRDALDLTIWGTVR